MDSVHVMNESPLPLSPEQIACFFTDYREIINNFKLMNNSCDLQFELGAPKMCELQPWAEGQKYRKKRCNKLGPVKLLFKIQYTKYPNIMFQYFLNLQYLNTEILLWASTVLTKAWILPESTFNAKQPNICTLICSWFDSTKQNHHNESVVCV